MQEVHYKSGRLAATPIVGALFTLGAGWLWLSGGGWMPLLMMLVFGFLTAVGMSNALSSGPALAWDQAGLAVRSGGRRHEVAWSAVHSIAAETFTLRYWGIVPVSRTRFLVIKVDGGLLGGKKLRINADSLAIESGALPLLVGALNQAHVAAVGEAGIVMKGAGPQGWGARSASSPIGRTAEPGGSGGFDPDAALARYLQRKEGEGLSAPEEARSAPPAPAPAPSVPVRPSFGRRGVHG